MKPSKGALRAALRARLRRCAGALRAMQPSAERFARAGPSTVEASTCLLREAQYISVFKSRICGLLQPASCRYSHVAFSHSSAACGQPRRTSRWHRRPRPARRVRRRNGRRPARSRTARWPLRHRTWLHRSRSSRSYLDKGSGDSSGVKRKRFVTKRLGACSSSDAKAVDSGARPSPSGAVP